MLCQAKVEECPGKYFLYFHPDIFFGGFFITVSSSSHALFI